MLFRHGDDLGGSRWTLTRCSTRRSRASATPSCCATERRNGSREQRGSAVRVPKPDATPRACSCSAVTDADRRVRRIDPVGTVPVPETKLMDRGIELERVIDTVRVRIPSCRTRCICSARSACLPAVYLLLGPASTVADVSRPCNALNLLTESAYRVGCTSSAEVATSGICSCRYARSQPLIALSSRAKARQLSQERRCWARRVCPLAASSPSSWSEHATRAPRQLFVPLSIELSLGTTVVSHRRRARRPSCAFGGSGVAT